MKCAVCTLFERQYHFGVAVFVNSLCASGFCGTVYAGYRGPLPPWAVPGAQVQANGQTLLEVTPDVRILFLPLKTTAHLTNYKPEFMLQVETLAAAETDALIYCDPDIVVDVKWDYIVDWLSCGVAVCEDVNSPLAEDHPTRVGWRRFFQQHGHTLTFRSPSYANGGFVGLTWNYRRILPLWQEFLARIGELLGGANVAGIQGGVSLANGSGFANCFSKTDQDALNAVLEAMPDLPVSFLNQSAMGFRPGKAILPHALGAAKPWVRPYLKQAWSGRPPGRVDKVYWKMVEGPLRPFSASEIAGHRRRLALASFLGRYIRRNS